jgi:hypothetical protein
MKKARTFIAAESGAEGAGEAAGRLALVDITLARFQMPLKEVRKI